MKIYIVNYDSDNMSPAEESRYQHEAGRRLLQTALSREGVFIDVSDEQNDLIFAYGPSGKPCLRELPDIHFNISHTKGLVVCAVGRTSVGIDAEKIKSYPRSVLRKMTEEEKSYIQCADYQDEAFMRVWTMKEAMIKLTGEGLAAFSNTECIPGKALSGILWRQMLWKGQYVITAAEKMHQNRDCILEKKV